MIIIVSLRLEELILNLKPGSFLQSKIMKYNPNTRESMFTLKDGRTLFKTHNGFKYWVECDSAKGSVIAEVNAEYYKTVKDNAIRNNNIL